MTRPLPRPLAALRRHRITWYLPLIVGCGAAYRTHAPLGTLVLATALVVGIYALIPLFFRLPYRDEDVPASMPPTDSACSPMSVRRSMLVSMLDASACAMLVAAAFGRWPSAAERVGMVVGAYMALTAMGRLHGTQSLTAAWRLAPTRVRRSAAAVDPTTRSGRGGAAPDDVTNQPVRLTNRYETGSA